MTEPKIKLGNLCARLKMKKYKNGHKKCPPCGQAFWEECEVSFTKKIKITHIINTLKFLQQFINLHFCIFKRATVVDDDVGVLFQF